MMKRVLRYYLEDWFRPAGPGNLGFCRMMIFGIAFVGMILLDLDYSWYGRIPTFYYKPPWLLDVLGVGVLPPMALQGLWWAFIGTCLLACVGLFTRVACAAALLLGLYLFGVYHSWGKIGHGDQLLTYAFLVMALSRSGDAWSVDAWLRRRRGKPAPEASGEYTWPIRTMWLVYAIFFCAAGYGKIRWSWDWVSSESFRNILIQHAQMKRTDLGLGLWVAQFPTLCKVLAGATVAVELGFPLILLHRAFRRFFAPAGFMMQLGIGLMMGVWFPFWILGYLFFVPWDVVGTAAAKAWPGRRDPAERGAPEGERVALPAPVVGAGAGEGNG